MLDVGVMSEQNNFFLVPKATVVALSVLMLLSTAPKLSFANAGIEGNIFHIHALINPQHYHLKLCNSDECSLIPINFALVI